MPPDAKSAAWSGRNQPHGRAGIIRMVGQESAAWSDRNQPHGRAGISRMVGQESPAMYGTP
jgi:hypothetical protein